MILSRNSPEKVIPVHEDTNNKSDHEDFNEDMLDEDDIVDEDLEEEEDAEPEPEPESKGFKPLQEGKSFVPIKDQVTFKPYSDQVATKPSSSSSTISEKHSSPNLSNSLGNPIPTYPRPIHPLLLEAMYRYVKISAQNFSPRWVSNLCQQNFYFSNPRGTHFKGHKQG